MRKYFNSLIVGMIVFLLSGCQTTGLSLRERDGFNYSNFLYSAYGQSKDSGVARTALRSPIKLSVAQIGEETPPAVFLEKIQNEASLIAKVQPLPAAGYAPDRAAKPEVEQLAIETMIFKMKMLAKDLGTDYLFIYGGSADYGSNPNFWSFLDMTLVGMYVFPSVDHVAEGKVSGALIDVESGKVLFVVSAQSKMSASAPSYGSYYGYQNPVLPKLRDDLVKKIADQLIQKLSS